MSQDRDISREAHWSRAFAAAMPAMDLESAARCADTALAIFDERFVPEKPKPIRGTPRGTTQ